MILYSTKTTGSTNVNINQQKKWVLWKFYLASNNNLIKKLLKSYIYDDDPSDQYVVSSG